MPATRRKALISLAAIAMAVAIASYPERAQTQAVQIVEVDVKPLATAYRASRLIGSTVTNDKNENIGSINDLLIDQKNKAIYAVLQVGSFLGLGGRLVVVTWDNLKLEDNGKKVVLPGASKDELKKLTEFHFAS